MRLVHMADLHQCFARYTKMTPTGANQREADVARSLVHAIDRTIALAPDLVIVAGDVFHKPRPANPAIVHAFRQFQRLVTALPKAKVIMLAGNHDLAPESAVTCILQLFTSLGIQVVDRAPARLTFPELGLAVMCVPEVDRLDAPLAPDPSFPVNVLAIHGEVAGVIPRSRPKLSYDADMLSPEWDYIAFGHFHDYTQVAPRAFYSGATDFTTSNTWDEAPVKGIIEYDLTAHAHTFHPLPVSRVHVDIPAIDGRGLGVEDLNAQIRAAVESVGGVEGKVARLKLLNVERSTSRALDHKYLAACKAAALNFTLDVRQPEKIVTEVGILPTEQRFVSLRQTLVDYLGERDLPADIDRERLVALALFYFDDATAAAPITQTTALQTEAA